MFGLCFRIQVRVLVHQIPHAHVLLAEGVILIKRLVAAMLTGAQHTAKAAPQAGTSGACGAAFRIYETEENAQRSAPLERMTF